MDPLQRSNSGSANGGQTAGPIYSGPSTSGPAPVAQTPTPAGAPVAPTPAPTSYANPFASGAASPAGTGDIVLRHDEPKKSNLKLPLIIGGIAAAILVVVLVILMALGGDKTIIGGQTSTTESFNKFFNYIYSGEESAEPVENPSKLSSDYKFTAILNTNNLNARQDYFKQVGQLWGDFKESGIDEDTMTKWFETDIDFESQVASGNLGRDVSLLNANLAFLTQIGQTQILTIEDIANYYQKNNLAKTKQYITDNYAPLINSNDEFTRTIGDQLSKYATTATEYVNAIASQKCLDYFLSDDHELAECPNTVKISQPAYAAFLENAPLISSAEASIDHSENVVAEIARELNAYLQGEIE